jgi:hypothetical protein
MLPAKNRPKIPKRASHLRKSLNRRHLPALLPRLALESSHPERPLLLLSVVLRVAVRLAPLALANPRLAHLLPLPHPQLRNQQHRLS